MTSALACFLPITKIIYFNHSFSRSEISMPNNYVIERLEGIRNTLVAQGSAGDPLASSSKGTEREIFVKEFLGKVFPSHFRFGTGTITDSAEKLSGQADIVIELPFFPSFPVPPSDVRLYLAEGVAAVIEVKSNLSTQWSEVESTTQKIKQLSRNYGQSSFFSYGMSPRKQIPVYAVGFQGYKSRGALMKRLNATIKSARPDGALVLDPGILVGNDITDGGTICAIGASALYGLIAIINAILNSLQVAGFNYESYIQ